MTIQSNTIAQKLFVQKFMTLLIVKSFNCLHKEHISNRLQAWNYLVSFMSRENGVIEKTTVEKCFRIILR